MYVVVNLNKVPDQVAHVCRLIWVFYMCPFLSLNRLGKKFQRTFCNIFFYFCRK